MVISYEEEDSKKFVKLTVDLGASQYTVCEACW